MKRKINKILSVWNEGEVFTLKRLSKLGLDRRRVHYHQEQGLLKALGGGAYVRRNDSLNWKSGIYTLQFELGKDVWISSWTALYLHGVKHHLAVGRMQVYVASKFLTKLPSWFEKNDWGVDFHFRHVNLFRTDTGINKLDNQRLPLRVSSRERAILEWIHDSDLSQSFESVVHFLETMQTLRHKEVQKLLEVCESIRVKRVFLYLSEKLNLPYFHKLNLSKIELGKGNRSIVKNGVYDFKYLITVPDEKLENPF